MIRKVAMVTFISHPTVLRLLLSVFVQCAVKLVWIFSTLNATIRCTWTVNLSVKSAPLSFSIESKRINMTLLRIGNSLWHFVIYVKRVSALRGDTNSMRKCIRQNLRKVVIHSVRNVKFVGNIYRQSTILRDIYANILQINLSSVTNVVGRINTRTPWMSMCVIRIKQNLL